MVIVMSELLKTKGEKAVHAVDGDHNDDDDDTTLTTNHASCMPCIYNSINVIRYGTDQVCEK